MLLVEVWIAISRCMEDTPCARYASSCGTRAGRRVGRLQGATRRTAIVAPNFCVTTVVLRFHLSLSLSLTLARRLPPAAAFYAPVARLSSRTRKPLPTEYCLPAVFQHSSVCAVRGVHSVFGRASKGVQCTVVCSMYMRSSPPSEACKVNVG